MKKLLLASLAVLAMGAQAASGTIDQNFNVTATLSSNCVASNSNGAPAVLAFGTYTGFGSTVTVAPTAGFTSKVDCSNNLAAAPTAAVTGGNTGIVVGVEYTLNVGAVSVALGANATTTAAAEADVYSVSVGGGIAAGQPGEVGAAASIPRVLVWTF
jgi:hypothetical protein